MDRYYFLIFIILGRIEKIIVNLMKNGKYFFRYIEDDGKIYKFSLGFFLLEDYRFRL